MLARLATISSLVVLVVAPLLLQPRETPPPPDARRLIVITPHNDQIRSEFARAFDRWHTDRFGQRVNVVYSVPGGSVEIRRMLQTQLEAALQSGRAPGGQADLVFGGGSYEHELLKRGVRRDGVDEPITEALRLDPGWLAATYGDNVIGDGRLYDPDGHWFGAALATFGIVYNRDVLRRLGIDDPDAWSALAQPALRGWVALVDPSQSGSITTAFDALLQRAGWRRGWQVLRRAGANARQFASSSLRPPAEVGRGDAAMGVCIDFYGRAQAQAIRVAGDARRMGFVEPPGGAVDADPISVLRGAPDPELARRFVEFCLAPEGQALWQLPITDDPAALGPRRFELRRLMIRRSMYATHASRLVAAVDPYALAAPAPDPDPDVRPFIDVLFNAMVLENHDVLRAAWDAIVGHPAYPGGDAIVSAADVEDPTLHAMLDLFDAMPTTPTPDGTTPALVDDAIRAAIRTGWLGRGWSTHGLWPAEAAPADVLRRRWAAELRSNYERVIALGVAASSKEDT
jgi:ABC-type Fe3+ transport system substrate-binding protein